MQAHPRQLSVPRCQHALAGRLNCQDRWPPILLRLGGTILLADRRGTNGIQRVLVPPSHRRCYATPDACAAKLASRLSQRYRAHCTRLASKRLSPCVGWLTSNGPVICIHQEQFLRGTPGEFASRPQFHNSDVRSQSHPIGSSVHQSLSPYGPCLQSSTVITFSADGFN